MKNSAQMQRPLDRMGYVLAKLMHLWHYYPAYSLAELVREVTAAANGVKSELPEVSMYDIEDIAYPKDSIFHKTRHLEMGIDALEEVHAQESLPPVPIQTALVGKIEDAWRKQPQTRLGQFLENAHAIAQMKIESA